jgi:hypothetical protein
MAGGALIQVVAVGEQDRYLTGDPEITFFKTVYRRHTNFAIETTDEIFYNGVDYGKACRTYLPRRADLISNITLFVKLGTLNPEFYRKLERNRLVPHQDKQSREKTKNKCGCTACLEEQYKDSLTYGWVNALGHALIKSTSIEIGGQRIDKQYGEWMEIWTELTMTEAKRDGYNRMIGKVDPASFRATTFSGEMTLYIPLQFWFCRHIGLSLPIMSLFYHLVEIVVDFRKFNELWVTTVQGAPPPTQPPIESCLLIDYIYLDVDERRQFFQESQIYLFEQLQYSGDCPAPSTQIGVDLYFNHPVKELIWVLQRNDVICQPDGLFPGSTYPKGNDWFNFSPFQSRTTTVDEDLFEKGIIQFNGVDRFKEREAGYFRLYQPYMYHTRVPTKNYIYVYTFGFRPEELNPSGQMNFSRVDNAKLSLTTRQRRSYTDYSVRVYGLSYNILIISTGMGGMLFYD